MENLKGVIIEESLDDTLVLKEVKILSTEIEPVTEGHKTPWIKQWTMHNVEVDANKADTVGGNWGKWANGDSHHCLWANGDGQMGTATIV